MVNPTHGRAAESAAGRLDEVVAMSGLIVEGGDPAVEVVAVRSEATGLLSARHWNRMVVDIIALRSLSALELFVFARGLSSDLSRNVRVALIVRQNRPDMPHLSRM